MPAPIIPWQPSNIPSEIQAELNRRKTNRSFTFKQNESSNWDANTGDWNAYKGPMVSWVRMCSNSAGNPLLKKPRFILNSGDGFYKTYGFNKPTPTSPNNQVIGYTPGENDLSDFGVPHTIDNTLITPVGGNFPINVPTPEISKIDVTVQKELFRRATVEWVCFSWKQLEYMTPYFLIPGITVMLEFGWNHFNPTSLVPLWDKNRMREMWKNSYPLYTENIIGSKGNYDVVYGIISNFHWSIEGSRIICSTEITSKDRIYAGLVSDGTVTVKNVDADNDDVPDSITKSLRDFVENNDVLTTAKIVAASKDPLKTIVDLTSKNSKLTPWLNILKPLITTGNNDIKNMRLPYVHGVFAGRPKHLYDVFGAPVDGDIDKSGTNQGDATSGQWINMGLVVEILNNFSALPDGGSKPIFTVDIQNSVIGGHPNLISCDSRVLIPNWQAPKFHYGAVGLQNYGFKDVQFGTSDKLKHWLSAGFYSLELSKALNSETGLSDYGLQYAKPISLAKNGSLPNVALAKVCYQRGITGKNCYRNDIDTIINMYRVLYAQPKANQSVGNVSVPSSWSFPASENSYLPESFYGLPGSYVEMDKSGLLSNIYISVNAFKDAVLGKLNTKATAKTFDDIYKSILELLNQSVDGFWDLVVVEAENTMTITDKKYVGNINLDKNPMCVFDYYDADSIIKSIKFKPALSNAQAIRSMFGETNNKESKYFISDPNDLIDYNFKDDVNYNEKARVEGEQNELEKRIALKQQMKDLIGTVQLINVADDSLQITLTRETEKSPFTDHLPMGRREVLKLCLPNPRILRMLLDDKDEENNQRYCAVQPGITLELTMLGIGGIRTFQYFMVKNLPEPYSQRNIIFRVTDVVQTLESGNWETMIRAQPLPLRKYIKMRVNPPVDGWPPERVIATRPG